MRTAFLFPGQGSQYVGMGIAWFRASAEARMLCDQADAQLGYALTQLCFEGPEAELNLTEFTQPAIFVVSVAMWRAVKRCYHPPMLSLDIVWVSLWRWWLAGAMDFDDGLQLVAERGRLMALCGRVFAGRDGCAPWRIVGDCGSTLRMQRRRNRESHWWLRTTIVQVRWSFPGRLDALEAALTLAECLRCSTDATLAGQCCAAQPVDGGCAGRLCAGCWTTVPLHEPEIPVVMNATAVAGV